MSLFKIHHITKYLYYDYISESTNQIILFPKNTENQEIISHDLNISHEPSIYKYNDYWGNTIGIFTINQPHNELIINSSLTVSTIATECEKEKSKIKDWQTLQELIGGNIILYDLAIKENIKSQDIIEQINHKLYNQHQTPLDYIIACNQYIYTNFKYEKGITNIETKIDDILSLNSGVCQDFAHVMLQLLRSKNIPARYVSGYVCPNKNGMRGEGATHAWVEAYIPNLGWVGLDPTNNCIVNDEHVKIAVGRHFKDCSPTKGIYRGTNTDQELFVYVSVGYEDGSVLECENEVIMTKESETSADKKLKHALAQQQ